MKNTLWKGSMMKKKQSTKTADCRLLTESEPGGTRTPNLLIRSQMLYPIKLQVR